VSARAWKLRPKEEETSYPAKEAWSSASRRLVTLGPASEQEKDIMAKPTYAELQRKVEELQRLADVKISPVEFYFDTRDIIYFKGYRDWSLDLFDRKIEDLTGYRLEDFLERRVKWIDIIYDQDLEIAKKAVKQALKTDKYYFAEYRIVKKRGDLAWVKIRGYITSDSSGDFQSLRGVINDITIEKYSKVASESFSGRLAWANSLKEGIYVVSKDYRIVFMNQALIDLVGDQTGKLCYEVLFHRDTHCPWSVMDRIVDEEACFIQEYELPLPDGIRVFQVRSIPIKLDDGSVGKLGHLKDITETRKLELEVRDLAARRRAIEDGANRAELGIFILQEDEGGEARFRFGSDAFCKLTGYDASELFDKSLAELVHPDSLPEIMERLRLTRRGEILDHAMEIKMVRKDRTPIIGRGSLGLASHEGHVAMIGFLRDISKRRMAEKALWRSQRLASIGRLAAEIAHELNNPLTSVVTFSKLLSSIMRQEPFPVHRLPELRNYVNYLQSETDRCASISRTLLDFSRQTKIEIKENDINAILEKTIAIVKHRAGLDQIEIRTQYASELPLVSCDFGRLQQVFVNILLNAIEAMPQGGVLTVATELDPTEHVIEVHITDTGTGIPEEDLERIFEPFFTTKEEGKGVGLGLSVAYGVIRQHHGEIQVQSRLGEGTQVTIQLPMGPRVVSLEVIPREARGPILGKGRILAGGRRRGKASG
jgi:two-component system NtrC family sensor kinase